MKLYDWLKRYAPVLTGIAITLLVLKGCAGLGKRLEPPRISLVRIQVQQATLFETVLKIDLRVYNANDVPLTVRGVDCQLKLQGKDFATGVSNERTIVPAFGTGVIPMMVYSSVLDVVKGLLTLPMDEKLEYALTGRVHLEGGTLMPASVSFKSEGRLSLKALN
ncbi:MAG: LEA type 2 family protein [Desulfobacterales bacterium]|nr:LEA type 2 family protein [Desulfobacterales bacterium]